MAILVSDAAAEESLQAYTSPLSLQAKALDDISEKVLNGAVVSDGNNPFTFLTEFSSNMTADIVTKACECFNNLYPENAQTSTELYKHLSDFGYVGLYATPASTTVELVFNRDFLIDNAVNIDSPSSDHDYDPRKVSGTYSKIIIPAYSRFTIGELVFGLMYPIEIRVRKAFSNGSIDHVNSIITVVWDTSQKNPLMPLETHILAHRDYVQDGVTLTAIEIPIYQFEVENHVENAIASTGFSKRYDYHDKFYAVRIFHFKNNNWRELEQSFSDTNYDTDIPTAIVKVLQDIGKVEIIIPHIYFNSVDYASRLGNRILVKLYTTKGEVNIDLSEYQLDQFTASFLLTDTNLVEDDTFSNMLKRIPTVFILPLSMRIDSGTNGITFQQLKNRVKYNNSYTVKITPEDLENYFNTSGYKFTKELDNITDRVYCAHKVLTDKTGTPIASGEGQIVISTSMVDSEEYLNSISKVDDQTFTINPSALYKYNEDDNTFILLTDQEKSTLLSTDLETKVNSFNNNLYTYSPFHVVVANSRSNPISGVFDMYNPVLRSIMLAWENNSTTVEVSVYRADIKPTIEGDKLLGYTLRVSLFKTNNIEDIASKEEQQENIRVLLTTETSSGLLAHMYGTYEGIDESGKDVFVFNITSDFRITKNGDIDLTSFEHELGNNEEVFVPSSAHTYTISFFMLDDTLSEVTRDSDENVSKTNASSFALPNDLDRYTMLCRQVFTLKLGEALPLLHGNITLATTDAVFKTYPTTQFVTYQNNVYDRWSLSDCKDVNAYIEEQLATAIFNYKQAHGEDPTDEEIEQMRAEIAGSQEVADMEEYNEDVLKKIGIVKYVEDDSVIPPKKGLVIKHKAGDVIVSSPYSSAYGPVISVSVDSMLLSMELQKKEGHTGDDEDDSIPYYKPSSSFDDKWLTLSSELYVECNSYPEFTGLYRRNLDLQEEFDYVNERRELLEHFDDRSIAVVASGIPNQNEIKGLYITCNSREIKNKIKDINLYKDINTSAKGTDRKYYKRDFNFTTYEGYVVEYCPAEASFGVSESWALNKYTRVIDPETGVISSQPELVKALDIRQENENRWIDEALVVTSPAATILMKDNYKKSLDTVRYHVHGSSDKLDWVMYKGDDKTDYTFYAKGISGNNRVQSILEPWEVEWKPRAYVEEPMLIPEDTEPPVVTLISTNLDDYKLATVDAGRFMCYRAMKLGQVQVSDLYRKVCTLENGDSTISYIANELEDRKNHRQLYFKSTDDFRIPGKIYYLQEIHVDPITDDISYEYTELGDDVNVELYFPANTDGKLPLYEEADFTYIIAHGKSPINQFSINSDIDIEHCIGTNSATGALYRLNYEASSYDYKKDGLTISHLQYIFGQWANEENGKLTESNRYETVLASFNQKYGGILSIDTLKKIVSDTKPSYYFPYDKVVTCGATDDIVEELKSYFESNTHDIFGIVSVLYRVYNSGLETIGEPVYVNYLTDKTYTIDNVQVQGLSINPAYSEWIDVDKWPWEYTTPWRYLHPDFGDVVGKVVEDFSITYNSQMSGTKILHDTSSLILDENGNPIIDEGGERELVYGIDTIQCDYKLRLSEDAEYVNYLDSIRDLIRSYLYELKAITPSLLARTKLYFTPIRTFGNAEFKGSGAETTIRPVQCAIELGLHIESYVHSSVTRKLIIRNEIIELILKDIKDGIINLAELAKTLVKELGDDIVYVDVLGINGDKTVQTLIPVEEDCYPQLKQILVLHDDGTIHVDHDLNLDWYVIN